MQKNILHIIWLTLLLGFASMVYYLSLVACMPFIVTLLVVATFGYFSYRWLSKNIVTEETTGLSKAYTVWPYIILLAGVITVTNKSYYIETKYGCCDSWVIWNYHAKFLQHPEYWKYMFSINPEFHADYPLFLPGIIAFLRRLTGIDNAVIPFAFGYFVTLVIPVSIFLGLYRKNLPLATLVFFLIITDDFYLGHGLAQYADLPLGLLFLLAFICLGQVKKQPAIVFVIAALLGCCAWMKNEGIMLAGIFTILNIKTLAAGRRWRYFAGGIALPVLTLAIFKSSAPVTDLIAGQNAKALEHLLDGSRYKITWEYLGYNFNHNFIPVKIGLFIYIIFCLVEKKLPGKDILILLCCTLGYCLVYVMTPKSIEWHIQTSMDRVLMQVMPAFMYVLGLRFCRLRFSLSDKQLE